MRTYLTVTPAYGRDYKSKAAVLADWKAGKDFQCAMSGQYLSNTTPLPTGTVVMIRYSRFTKIVQV